MTRATRGLPWTDSAWRAAVRGWVRESLAAHRITPAGPMRTKHLRPWSFVARIATDHGPFFFKATAPTLANDAAITRALSARHPDLVLAPLAVDAARRWMLLPNGGRRLRTAAGARRRLIAWEALLPRYAELQRGLRGREEWLLDLGALDRRPTRLVEQLRRFLDDPDATRIGRSDGLTSADVSRLRANLQLIGRLSEKVDASGIGASIQHDDLHDGNVFAGRDGTRIFDWGDASVSHPLATFVVLESSLRHHLGLASDARELRRLRDAYLEPWTVDQPRAAVEETLRTVERIYPIMRGLTWTAAMAALPPDAPHEFRSAPAEWMRDFSLAEDER